MPGYILHLTEATMIIKELKQEGYPCPAEWCNAFLLGNLLPDTKIKKAKITSHFWNPEDLKYQAIAPDLSLFLEKYGTKLQGPLMLGYLSHLYLDACFVNSFWDSMWEFLDGENHPEILQEKIRFVHLKQKNQWIPVSDFFSSEYYYGDYSRMNAYLLHKYKPSVPVFDPALTCPITEVHMEDLHMVLGELQHLCDTLHPGAEEQLAVFDLPSLEAFISETALQMSLLLMEKYL
ncbi:MAG: hypothetical protein Q4B85_11260 [Lachnospiraceae bacterium]|nr:hypothetical protein [Lachnospiraceae bacterium]